MVEIWRSKIARNSAYNLIGMTLPLAIGLLLIPVTLHGLGPARFGLLSLSLTVLEFSTLFALGLGPATTKHVAEALARDDDTASELIVMSMFAHALLGALGGLLIAILAPLIADHVFSVSLELRPEAISVFRLLGLMVPATLLLLSLFGALEGASQFGLVNLLRVPMSTLSFVIPAVGVVRGISLPAILAALVALRLIVCAALAYLVAVKVPGHRWQLPRSWSRLRPLLSFGAWLSVSNLVSPILVYGDRFFLGRLSGMAALGIYSAPSDAVMRLLAVPSSLLRAMFPKLSALQATSDGGALIPLFRRAVLAIVAILGAPVLVLVLFGPSLLSYWLGTEIGDRAGDAVRVLAVGILFNAAAFVPGTFLAAFGRPDLSAKFHLLELVFYLPLVWWLVTRYGIVGAAAGWSIRVTVDALLLFVMARRLLRAREGGAGNSMVMAVP